MRFYHYLLLFSFAGLSCNSQKIDYDASGSFEADEVIVSAQQSGQLLSFSVKEGMHLNQGDTIGRIDVTIPDLQRQQTAATIASLKQKTSSSENQAAVTGKQLAVQQSQLDYLYHERQRTQNLVVADASPRKPLDDINAQIDQLEKQLAVSRQQIQLYKYNTATQNRGILSEKAALVKVMQQFQEQVDKGRVINPVSGTVLTSYALRGEMASTGKPLYKIASLDTLILRAYIMGSQLPSIRLSQPVTVRIDQGDKSFRSYRGTINWIADKAEFTPKTIQTKEERTSLVYAIKILVPNDGFLKIGMYGEVIFNANAASVPRS